MHSLALVVECAYLHVTHKAAARRAMSVQTGQLLLMCPLGSAGKLWTRLLQAVRQMRRWTQRSMQR